MWKKFNDNAGGIALIISLLGIALTAGSYVTTVNTLDKRVDVLEANAKKPDAQVERCADLASQLAKSEIGFNATIKDAMDQLGCHGLRTNK